MEGTEEKLYLRRCWSFRVFELSRVNYKSEEGKQNVFNLSLLTKMLLSCMNEIKMEEIITI